MDLLSLCVCVCCLLWLWELVSFNLVIFGHQYFLLHFVFIYADFVCWLCSLCSRFGVAVSLRVDRLTLGRTVVDGL